MVGKGVLLECIDDPRVEKVLIVNRNPLELSHPKVEEIIHKDFSDFSAIESQLQGVDACFHCMGVSNAGLSEERYYELTYSVSRALAIILFQINPNLLFIYVSGAGTDSTEKGNMMWARVKGKTENMILNMGFRDSYAFRPGVIIPERGVKSRTRLYNIFYFFTRPFFPLLKKIKGVTTTSKIGKAMIHLYEHPQTNKHFSGTDINEIAEMHRKSN